MGKQFTVSLDEAFEFGELDGPHFYDFPQLVEAQQEIIFKFMYDVSKGAILEGKNKPSYENNDLSDAEHCQTYKDLDCWHYHCGPTYRSGRNHKFTHDLNRNLYGSTSDAAIHYRKIVNTDGDVEILILGFAPKHAEPEFPRSDKPGIAHPLFE